MTKTAKESKAFGISLSNVIEKAKKAAGGTKTPSKKTPSKKKK